MSATLEDLQSTAHDASELIDSEQLEKREMEEQLSEITVSLTGQGHKDTHHLTHFTHPHQAHETELTHENEQLKLQVAEMSIMARIKNDQTDGNSETIMEKYLDTRRELEMLRQRVSLDYEDDIERLEASKRSLEKKV